MYCYQQEFGMNFELGFELNEYSFLNDKSYRHDTCPSFYFKRENTYYILWVEDRNKQNREDENNIRYTVVEAENFGDDEYPELQTKSDSKTYIATEYPPHIIAYLAEIKIRFS